MLRLNWWSSRISRLNAHFERRLFGSAMMGEALRERREILLESFDILKKEATMGAERVYRLSGRYLYAHNGKSVFEVDAEELRRVIIAEGRQISDGTIRTLFGMSFNSIFELRRQYDLRDGPATMTPEAVRATFGPASAAWPEGSASILHCPACWGELVYKSAELNERHPEGLICPHCKKAHRFADFAQGYERELRRVRAGRDEVILNSQLGFRTVRTSGEERRVRQRRRRMVLSTYNRRRSGQHGRRRGEVVQDQIFDLRRVTPRRKPWDGTCSTLGERRTNCGGRRAGDRLERRAPPGHPPRRSGAAERRTSIIRPLTEWEHECRSDYGHRTMLRSPFCPECGLSRLRGVERRSLAHRRSPFSAGRRREDA